MVYIMQIYVDGGCRGNGKPGARGAAGAVFKFRNGRQKAWVSNLPLNPPPTNQRAEITAIIIALEQALAKLGRLRNSPKLRVRIFADSKYAIGCMTEWNEKWVMNGWKNAARQPVANRDLIIQALELHDELLTVSKVKYTWIPREENEAADRVANKAMDN